MTADKPDPGPGVVEVRTLAGEALVGRRVSDVAHDLATPLSTISLRAELLLGRLQRQHTPEADNDARAVRTILAEAARCAQLLGVLRTFAQGAAGEEPQLLTLGPLVDAAWVTVASTARRKNVQLVVGPELAHTQCRLPPAPARLLLLAVVSHAVATAAARTTVSLEARTEGATLAVAMRWQRDAEAVDGRDIAAAREAADACGVRLEVDRVADAGELRVQFP